jgi:hypothetical protein
VLTLQKQNKKLRVAATFCPFFFSLLHACLCFLLRLNEIPRLASVVKHEKHIMFPSLLYHISFCVLLMQTKPSAKKNTTTKREKTTSEKQNETKKKLSNIE